MTEQILGRIEQKLDIIINLIANRLIEGKSKTDSIKALGALGLDRDLIAKIVDTTPETVSSRLSEAKKSTIKKSKKQRTKSK